MRQELGGFRSRTVRRLVPLTVGGALACLAFFTPAGVAAQECLDCHDEAEVVAETAHGFLDCTDCHPAAADPHDEGMTPEQASAPPECATCHEDAIADFEASVHGTVTREEGEDWLAGCTDCHGDAHSIVLSSEETSPVHAANLPETCGSCHADPEMAERYRLRIVQPLEAYLASVHAEAVVEEGGASCGACHGSHDILPAADPSSKVHHRNVASTCGQCHEEITAAYERSIHGQAAALGIRESPVCTDCHGEHRILSPDQKASPVYASNIPRMTCGRCHGDLRLNEKYGLSKQSVPAYEDSYHGLSSRAGAVEVAQCASCHGVHDILPSSDPESHVHKANLPETCGQCHPGAGARFAIGPVHVLPTEREHVAVFYIRRVYLWLIFLTIGGMLLHNGLDFARKLRRRHVPPPPSPEAPERMSFVFRVTHGLLAVSFIVLAYTGFALKFPESWWASPILRWEESFSFRGVVHRWAAGVMVFAAVLHVAHLIRSAHARACIRGMVPDRDDWLEIKARIAWLVGLRSEPPRTQWLGYGEKIEYWAVIWGTVVMTLTGVALWFEGVVLRLLPGWVPDVATVIHYYEAVLAGLAIIVWHFYAVIFDPDVYPMDFAWLTGRSAPAREAEREPPKSRRERRRRGESGVEPK